MNVEKNVILIPGDRTVSWADQLPKSWKYNPLKYVVRINQRVLDENTDQQKEIRYIDISNVSSQGEIIGVQTLYFQDAPTRARRIVSSGDTLISTVRTYLRAIAFCESAEENLICSTGFAVLTPSVAVFPKFLFYWVRSAYFVDEIVSRSVGVSYPAINASEIGSLPFPMISVTQQRSIADFLDRQMAATNTVVQSLETQISNLREYQESLCTSAVMGQLSIEGDQE